MRSNAEMWNDLKPLLDELTEVPARAVTSLSKKYKIESPKDLKEYIERLGIPIIKTSKLPAKVSGLVRRQGEECYIFVNRLKSKKHQNFTIAHEIGHIALNHSEDNKNAVASQELQATAFANMLLLSSGTDYEEIQEYYRENPEAAATVIIPAAIVVGFGLFVVGRFAVETICKLLSPQEPESMK
jgi:Zn-dependent peptidase ImmA (M78 family)